MRQRTLLKVKYPYVFHEIAFEMSDDMQRIESLLSLVSTLSVQIAAVAAIGLMRECRLNVAGSLHVLS